MNNSTLDVMIKQWLEAEEKGRTTYATYLFVVAVNYYRYEQHKKENKS